MTITEKSIQLTSLQLDSWRQLRHFNLYRIVLAFTLNIIFYSPFMNSFLGKYQPGYFATTAFIFFLSSFIYLYLDFKKSLTLETQVILASSSDILLITLMMHYSGGLSSGLGMLLIINIVASGTFLKSRDSFVFAAMASIAVIVEHTIAQLANISPTSLYSAAGILGIVFFASNMLAAILARRARESEALANQRTADLLNLENLNETIIHNMRTGVIVVTTNDEIIMANDSAETLLGETKIEYGMDINIVSPNLATRFHEWLEQPNTHQQPVPQPQGLPDIQPGFRKLGTSTENIGNTLIFLEDATQLNQRFQQIKLASLGRLTASIAHEIRNPLSAINHAAQLLSESELSSADEKLTQIITTQVQRLDKTIKNVLQLSRQEENIPDKINLIEWLPDFKKEFCARHKLEPGQLTVYSSESVYILFGRTHLQQVIDNLCNNALMHSNKTESEVQIKLIASHNEETGQPYLDIIDNGPGIDYELAQQIFDPFFTTNTKGTGLGLYISKEIIESNRAKIRYIDKMTEGSCFRIYFIA
ncbi:MAG: ATP-binding protein [Gammaproteobacteria bacterium]|nr:ATP-binding protein [Gammaproteobacteria bacterium]